MEYATINKTIIHKTHVMEDMLENKTWDRNTGWHIVNSLYLIIGDLSYREKQLENKIKTFDYDGQTNTYWRSVKKEDRKYLKRTRERKEYYLAQIPLVFNRIDELENNQLSISDERE